MTSTVNPQGRRFRPSQRRASRGGAMVEFAIVTPILLALILWANYFWEVSVARIKSAEVARYVAFERTVRSNLPGIVAEAKNRYKDLDGSTKGVNTPKGMLNRYTLNVTASLKRAPLSGSLSKTNSDNGGQASNFLSDISSLVGDSVEKIIGLLGFDTNQGAVQADVEIQVENRIVPKKIVNFASGFNDNRLNLKFKDSFFVYHDTWKAWGEGLRPQDTYANVQRITQDRVMKVAYIGLAEKAAGVLGPAQSFLEQLGLEIPLSPQYIKDSVLIKKVREGGRYNSMFNRQNRTVPGDVLQAFYWMDERRACLGNQNGANCRRNTEPANVTKKRGMVRSSGDTANWPMRAYNCRGDFFQGARKSKDPEVVYSTAGDQSYFNYGPNSCED